MICFLRNDNDRSLMQFILNSGKCSILERYTESKVDDTEILYKVNVTLDGNSEITVQGIPRRAIKFVDNAYSADQHMSGTFRHEIGIPDEIFPNTWRDQKTDNFEESERDEPPFIDNTAHWHIEDISSSDDEECRFFLAESSIPGAGMSMYAGTDISIGEYTQPELAVHIMDISEQGSLRCAVDIRKRGRDIGWRNCCTSYGYDHWPQCYGKFSYRSTQCCNCDATEK